MKKFFVVVLLLVVIFSFAQKKDSVKEKEPFFQFTFDIVDGTKDVKKKFEPLTKKGTMFVFWGWNRAGFTKSDIRFKGADYDFTLHNVVAHDRPSDISWDYINPGEVSKPQFNFRLGYFIKDNLAVVIAQDHMKYVMDQDQTVDFSGNISDPVYASMVQNGQINLADEKFLTFEHTDGLNYVNTGLEKYKTLFSKEKIDILWSYGAGAGVLFPRSNVKIFGNERSDRFHVAGFGTDARTNINFVFWKRWMARVEGKVGYINMPDVKTTLQNKPDKASHDFFFGQINFGIGYIFNQKRNKD